MALSNTATPKYYGQFRDAVVRGEIPVCENISLEMNRIDELIANPGIYYDDKKVEGWIKFCENELTLTDGSDMFLLDSFKLWGEQLFGWYYYESKNVWDPIKQAFVYKDVKRRLINKQYLIVGRGAAKTMYGTSIQAYELVIDTSTTSQITTSPTMKQSEEMLSPIRTAITRSRGKLFKLLTAGSLNNTTGNPADRQKLASTKDGIKNFITNSVLEIKPLSIPKLQGLRCKVATVDEWLSCDIKEDPIGAIEQGAAKEQSASALDDYMIIAMSSEGTFRNGVGDTIKMELMDILRGNIYAPYVSIWYYRLDDIKEINNPRLWVKANPNLGKTVTFETYKRDVDRAKSAPSTANDIIAKRFNIPQEGFSYFFTYEETLPHKHHTYTSMRCSMGADLSQGDDFCAFTFMFPLGYDRFGIKARSYISRRTLDTLSPAMRRKYDDFINEGSLIILEGTTIDIVDVYDDLDRFIIENDYDVCAFGYDPYNAAYFIERWERENSPWGMVKVPQGVKTETVPLGELKKLAKDRLLLFDQEIMKFCMGNCITLEDTNGNRKLLKKRREEKIDNVSAMMDAFVAYKLNKDGFE